MKLLIIGCKGQLGSDLIIRSEAAGFEHEAADLPELDISDREQVRELIKISKPSLVINAAAYTAVDKAETEEELANKVNVVGTGIIAVACSMSNIPFIHISTDYVFDGLKTSPYLEDDPTSPQGVYGKSKEQSEKMVWAALRQYIIIRTAWLYGVHGHNFVKTMLKLGMEREVLRVVADQYGCPTCSTDLAEAILTIADRIRKGGNIKWGTYHYCGQGITTWHEFTEKILEFARPLVEIKTRKIEAIATAEYPRPAKRPAYSALDCTKISENFGVIPKPWRDSLKTVVEAILRHRD